MRVSMVVAERSGDQLAALLLGGMQQRWPDLQASGIGGPQMQAQGFVAHDSCDELAVRGLVEVLLRYRRIHQIRQNLLSRLQQTPPDVFIGVDASDFNLAVEQKMRRQGVPAVQLVCPSIWAWRPERVARIRQSVDHVLCLYPFEPALLAQHGIAATFVGHPVADVIPLLPDRAQARSRLRLASDATVVALLPGSRWAEVKYLTPAFLQAAQCMLRQRPGLVFVLPTHTTLLPHINHWVAAAGLSGQVQVVLGQSHDVQQACDVALVASGTATLETALFKRPMVIAYQMQWLSWRIANGKRLLPWVGLPNILCQESLVPEFLQDQVQPQALAQAVLAWLDQPEAVQRIEQRFTKLHHTLRQNMPALSAHAIEEVLRA